MKKTKRLLFFFAVLFAAGSLFAEEGALQKGNAKKHSVKYITNINALVSYPPEALLGVTQDFIVPVLNYDTLLTKESNIKFRFGAELTPVSLEGKFGITWTPLAFLELYMENRIGAGWEITGKALGTAINENNNGISNFKASNFGNALYTFTAGGALQFDLGAVIDHDWAHIIFKIDQFAVYKGLTGVDRYTSWLYQNDLGKNRNGWRYGASYILGYKMPLPLDLIAVKIDTEKSFFAVPDGLDKRIWGEDRIIVTVGPVFNFAVKKNYNIILLAQFRITPAILNEKDLAGNRLFYQTTVADKTGKTMTELYRASIFFSITIEK